MPGLPGGGGGLGRGMAVPGGIGGLILVAAIFFVTQFLAGGGTGPSALPFDTGQVQAQPGSDLTHCQTGADANQNTDCRVVATVNAIQGYWDQALPQQAGIAYEPSVTSLFQGAVQTGCGGATSQVGPFYCPADDGVYLDMSFFDAMLEGRLGAQGGDFAEAYVVAHEYGHHIQDLLGTMGQVRTQQGPDSDAVRLELQADCYAGMWAKAATTVEDEYGEVLIQELTQQDIEEAIDAAEAVGDDRIQAQTQGQVTPETWTHGSTEDRVEWFGIGMREGTLEACDTFAVSRV
jgi:predicted metalloprotease